MCPCRNIIRTSCLLCCLLCLLGAPFLTAGASQRLPLGARGSYPKICIEALGRLSACLPGRLFSSQEAPRPRARHLSGRRLFRSIRSGCDSAREISNRERRRRIISSLIGTEIPDLSFRYDGLKLGLDVSTDLTGIEYNGVRLDYSICW